MCIYNYIYVMICYDMLYVIDRLTWPSLAASVEVLECHRVFGALLDKKRAEG